MQHPILQPIRRAGGTAVGLFKKASPAYKELLDVCYVLGSSIGKCGVGEMPPDYLEFTTQNQAATFRAKLEAYGTEVGSKEKAWSAAEDHVGMIAKTYMNTQNMQVDKKRLAERVTEVLMATMGASAAQTAGNLEA
jgi:hypothetical protein